MSKDKKTPFSVTGTKGLQVALMEAAREHSPQVSRSHLCGWILQQWIAEQHPALAKRHGIK